MYMLKKLKKMRAYPTGRRHPNQCIQLIYTWNFLLSVSWVTVTKVLLNVIDKEYRIKLWKQLLYGIIMVSLTTLLIIMTGSVWLTIIPRGIYALTNHYNHRFKGGRS